MNRTTLRAAIAVFTVATAVIHFYLNFNTGAFVFQPAFTVNAVGYLALLAALLLNLPFLAGREKLTHYVFIGYTTLTIVAYFAVNGAESFANPLGLVTKVIEVLLIAALWQHLRLSEKPA